MKTGLNWAEIEEELSEQEIQMDDDNNFVKMLFIGKVFNLYPSGKYYMPWACSNLEPCNFCKGSGELDKRTTKQKRRFSYWEKQHAKAIKRWKGDGSLRSRNKMWKIAQIANKLRDTTCPHCRGMGSIEALRDEEWREAFENKLEERGFWSTCGEGDPTDIFIGMTIDDTEEQYARMVKPFI